MDDFGNALHWVDQARGYRSMALYGYAGDETDMGALLEAVDFDELRVAR